VVLPTIPDTLLAANSLKGERMASVLAYVDGFNLYHGLHEKFGRRYHWLDLEELVRRLRPQDTIVGIKYFTAMIRNDPAGEARQSIYLDALAAHTAAPLEIVLGHYLERPMRCTRCGATWMSYEEKETDVNIASAVVCDAAMGASEMTLLISADSDLCPAIRTARAVAAQDSRKLGVVVAFPPRRRSFTLAGVASTCLVSQHHLRLAQLPAVVHNPTTGQKYRRPPKWS
jgi:hypothetical protein